MRRAWLIGLALGAALALGGCRDGGGDGTATVDGAVSPATGVPDTGAAGTTIAGPDDAAGTTAPTGSFADFGETSLVVSTASGERHEGCVLVAADEDLRSRGLMGVRDLGPYVGMVFVFDGATETSFYMRDTPMPLSIAFFDGAGRFISTLDMPPCPPDTQLCPLYGAGAPFELALEVPQGELAGLGIGPGATVAVGGAC